MHGSLVTEEVEKKLNARGAASTRKTAKRMRSLGKVLGSRVAGRRQEVHVARGYGKKMATRAVFARGGWEYA